MEHTAPERVPCRSENAGAELTPTQPDSIIRPFGLMRTSFIAELLAISALNPVPKVAWSSVMHGSSWTPSIVPYGADQTVYLIIDRFDGPRSVYRETEFERTNLETVIADLMSGQFNDPIRVVAYNTLEHWLQNISEEIALEIQTRCDIDGEDVPEPIRDFVGSYTGSDRQLANEACVIP
jgi:hypothetical protein